MAGGMTGRGSYSQTWANRKLFLRYALADHDGAVLRWAQPVVEGAAVTCLARMMQYIGPEGQGHGGMFFSAIENP